LIARTEATANAGQEADNGGPAIWAYRNHTLRAPAGSAKIIVYGITMLSEALYSRTMIETVVRSRDWSAFLPVALRNSRQLHQACFPPSLKVDGSALFRWFARPVSTLQLVDG